MIINPYVFGSVTPPVTVNQYMGTTFTGDGATSRNIAGVDLSSGGIAWIKRRNSAERHYFYFSVNGSSIVLDDIGENNAVEAAAATFSGSGISLTSAAGNTNLAPYICWSMKKEAGFLDIVSYTGNGANRTIAHALGTGVAAMLIKSQGATNWIFFHKNLGGGSYMIQNQSSASFVSATHFNNTAPTSSVFSLGTSTTVNQTGVAYTAFLFADNPSGVIQACTYVGDGAAPGPTVSLGWQPQFAWFFGNGAQSRQLVDQTRTPGFSGSDESAVTSADVTMTSADCIQLVSGGFRPNVTGQSEANFNVNARTYYGLAIRAP